MQMLAKKRATQTNAEPDPIESETASPDDKKAMFQRMMDMKRKSITIPSTPPPPSSDVSAAKKKFLMEMMAKKRAMANQ